MFKKLFFPFLLISLVFIYAWVYSNFYKIPDIKLIDILSKNIYKNSNDLLSSMVVYESKTDISKFEFSSSCNLSGKFFKKLNNYYFFTLKFNDSFCTNWNIYLKSDWKIFSNTNFHINLISVFDLYNKYTDLSNIYIEKYVSRLIKEQEKFEIFSKNKSDNFYYDFSKKQRYYFELVYKIKILQDILEKRNVKYQIPIYWYNLPTLKTKLPNSGRPYRWSYTDWIHEWWDIDAPFRTEVVALDDAIVVKVVDGFKFSDLNKIKYWDNLSTEDKSKNLDILRWNQVWLKTMKWDLVFYSHLDEVYDDIKVWNYVYRWTAIWRVWITGVPDKNYSDYHLHFEVRRNPYNPKMAWKYSLDDYMKWDWYFKWQTADYIKENQYNIFDK